MNLIPVRRSVVDLDALNRELPLPYSLRIQDFQMAMQDV